MCRFGRPGALQLRTVELRVLQLRVVKFRVLQLCVAESRTLQLRVVETRTLQLRSKEFCPVQLGAGGASSPVPPSRQVRQRGWTLTWSSVGCGGRSSMLASSW
jgi:hypothetical protein